MLPPDFCGGQFGAMLGAKDEPTETIPAVSQVGQRAAGRLSPDGGDECDFCVVRLGLGKVFADFHSRKFTAKFSRFG